VGPRGADLRVAHWRPRSRLRNYGTQLVTTIRVVTSDGQTDEEGRTVRGTVDDEEGEMRRRGARECEEALMEATEARRGYARVAAWDEGNLIQAMARLKNPTIAWRYGDG
jgi:hypothetical protein